METKVDTAWCPGCGNFAIRDVLEKALQELPVPANKIVLTSGIGQAAKMPHYLEVNYFNGLHGRSLPLAVGIKLARPDLTVIAYSGDGCMYGEGGNHFIHTIRRRLDLTILVSDNQVYALTKGQSSPTTDPDVKNPLSPEGSRNIPLNPLALAITMGAPFVARGFAGEKEHLKELIKQAILFQGDGPRGYPPALRQLQQDQYLPVVQREGLPAGEPPDGPLRGPENGGPLGREDPDRRHLSKRIGRVPAGQRDLPKAGDAGRYGMPGRHEMRDDEMNPGPDQGDSAQVTK